MLHATHFVFRMFFFLYIYIYAETRWVAESGKKENTDLGHNHCRIKMTSSVEAVGPGRSCCNGCLCNFSNVLLFFSFVEPKFYQRSAQQHHWDTPSATLWKKESEWVCACVCVCYSGMAAHKVSLIWWHQAHWTTDTELNLLLLRLRSNDGVRIRARAHTCTHIVPLYFSQVGSSHIRAQTFTHRFPFSPHSEDRLFSSLTGTSLSLQKKKRQHHKSKNKNAPPAF